MFNFFDSLTPADTGSISPQDLDILLDIFNEKGLHDLDEYAKLYAELSGEKEVEPVITVDFNDIDTLGLSKVNDNDIEAFLKANPERLQGITIEDMRDFLTKLVKIDNENQKKIEAEELKGIEAKYPDLPDAIKSRVATFYSHVQRVEKTENGYKIITNNDPAKKKLFEWESWYNNEGQLLISGYRSIGDLGNGKCLDYFYEDGSLGQGFDGEYATKMIYDNGVVDYENYDKETGYRQFGKTRFNYSTNDGVIPENFQLNTGLPNEAELSFEKDENGQIKDITLTDKTSTEFSKKELDINLYSPIKMEEAEKNKLIILMNAGKEFAKDYDIVVENNKMKIQAVVYNQGQDSVPPIPDIVNNDFFRMQEEGFNHITDFKLVYTEDGEFKFELYSKAAIKDAVDSKEISYSKDGKRRTIQTYEGNEIKTTTESTQEIRSRTEIQQRDDKFLEALLKNDFEKANEILGNFPRPNEDFNFYAACKKYETITGRSFIQEVLKRKNSDQMDASMLKKILPNIDYSYIMDAASRGQVNADEAFIKAYNYNMEMFEVINNFDPKTSVIRDLIPDIERQTISKDEFREKIGDKTYIVKITDDKLSVTKDGKTFDIDITGVNDYNRNILKIVNAQVLYRLASENIKINWSTQHPETFKTEYGNSVTIPGSSNIEGSYNWKSNSITIYTDKGTAESIASTIEHETGHSVCNSSKDNNEKLNATFQEELQNWQNSDEPFKDGQHTYCTNHIDEMFAEAYSLAVTGKSDGAYTITKYFPKTFAIIKQIIEEREK